MGHFFRVIYACQPGETELSILRMIDYMIASYICSSVVYLAVNRALPIRSSAK